jgi:hypothetical protein
MLEAAHVGVLVAGKDERVKVFIVLKEGEAAFPRQPVIRKRSCSITTRKGFRSGS